ncbi:flagellar basal body-associated FliL family protein [Caproiciproducens sp. MSJ-32]|uniref:flagellar basal body-associated FliL family protein n=1 Tax=Caproiciproducens sp. MSJ-32 TaxID=2841527 RepID=UPI001C128ECD|nr:flagellar basal body-associated FliL family protein [Caproiciproducens sp. MSJ-32]MBU5454789.1 flagellar basal body-associated FliL family protein [Caproiciproducens sp. MSJ-32]
MAKNKEEKKGKGRRVLIIFAVIAAIGVGVFAGTYFAMNKSAANEPVYIKEAYYEVGEIFVNLSDENSRRYVKLNLSISYDSSNKEIVDELNEKAVAIKDIANFYFKSCKAKDFEPANEAVLKGTLLEKINTKLTSGKLVDVYISEIIVQ